MKSPTKICKKQEPNKEQIDIVSYKTDEKPNHVKVVYGSYNSVPK